MAGIFEDINSGVVTDPEDVMEKSRIVSFMAARDTTQTKAKFTSYPQSRLGHNNPGNLQLTNLGSSSTNPTEQVYLKPFVFFPNAASTPAAVTVTIVIDYTAIFSEMKQPTKS
jgi:hypothetical protein